jgi:hypothetical protein
MGPNPAVWTNAQTYSFTITYTAATGLATIRASANQNLAVNLTKTLTPGKALAGFYFFVNSTYAGGTDPAGAHAKTEAFNLSVTTNNGVPQSIPSITADYLDSFILGPNYFFDSPTTDFAISGNLRFSWNAGANLNNERNKFTLKLLEGNLVPAPAAGVLVGLGGLLAARRRR